jgi:transcriptional regulator with XRE-family HTH domain
MNIGATIKLFRKEHEFSQKTLAYQLGITQTYLSLLETNKKNASPKLIKKICKLLHISIGGFYMLSVTKDDVPAQNIKVFETLKPTLELIFFKK